MLYSRKGICHCFLPKLSFAVKKRKNLNLFLTKGNGNFTIILDSFPKSEYIWIVTTYCNTITRARRITVFDNISILIEFRGKILRLLVQDLNSISKAKAAKAFISFQINWTFCCYLFSPSEVRKIHFIIARRFNKE